MVDVGVALTWIAMSAVSAKGLSMFARAVVSSDVEAEVSSLAADGAWARDSSYAMDTPSWRLSGRP